jgi:hypothetical protein
MANANIPQNFNLILPAGTQIVTKIEVKWKREAMKPIQNNDFSASQIFFKYLTNLIERIFLKS